jgi:hypothetical protein
MNDPYLVSSPAELAHLAAEVNGGNEFRGCYFRLTRDIDLKGLDWTPIGSPSAQFRGRLDGDGHAIVNMSVNLPEREEVGLFGRMNGCVSDLYIQAANVHGKNCAGTLAARNDGAIRNVTSRGVVRAGEACAGGLVGCNDGTIENASSSGVVRGESLLGGLVGDNGGLVRYSVSKVDVTGGEESVGGVTGINSGKLENVVSFGSVEGSYRVGGLSGFNEGTAENCAAYGVAVGVEVVGGLVGDNRGSVLNCLSSGGVRGVDIAGGLVGFNTGEVVNSIFDLQGSGMDAGVGWDRTDGSNVSATGLDTRSATDPRGAAAALGNGWMFSHGHYPKPDVRVEACHRNAAEDSVLSGVPLYFEAGDSSSGVTGSFTVPTRVKGAFIEWSASPGAIVVDSSGRARIVSPGVRDVTLTAVADDERKIFNLTILEKEEPGAGGRKAIAGNFAGGDGSVEQPYRIAEADQLAYLARLVNGGDDCEGIHFKLVNDIDLSCEAWTPIGISRSPFMGSLDGNGRTILGLRVQLQRRDLVGLFGCIGSRGSVSALCISGADVAGRSFVGALAGHNGGLIIECSASASVIGTSFNVGGLVGANHGTVEKSASSGKVETARFSAGGLIGVNYGRLADGASSCDVTGDVDVGGLVGVNIGVLSKGVSSGVVEGKSDIGGLVGINERGGTVEESASWSDVQGGARLGGLIGNNSGGIKNSAADCVVAGVEYIGGLVGQNYLGGITNCASSGRVSGSQCVGGLVGINLAGIVSYSASCADVTGDFRLGGLMGNNLDTVKNCLASGSVSGRDEIGGLVGNNVNILINANAPMILNSLASGGVVTDGSGGGITAVSFSPLVGCVFDVMGTGQTLGVGETAPDRETDRSATELTLSGPFSSGGAIDGLGGEWTYKENYYPQPKGLADNINPEVRAISGLCAVHIHMDGSETASTLPETTADGVPRVWSAGLPDSVSVNGIILRAEAGGKVKIFKLPRGCGRINTRFFSAN